MRDKGSQFVFSCFSPKVTSHHPNRPEWRDVLINRDLSAEANDAAMQDSIWSLAENFEERGEKHLDLSAPTSRSDIAPNLSL